MEEAGRRGVPESQRGRDSVVKGERRGGRPDVGLGIGAPRI